MIIVAYRRVFFSITAIMVALALGALLVFGLPLGIDFTGGTLLEVSYTGEKPAIEEVQNTLTSLGMEHVQVRTQGTDTYSIKAGTITEEMRAALPEALTFNGQHAGVIGRFTEIGPTIGNELRSKALVALTAVLVAIMLFIAFAFRKVSRPVSSWVYGLVAVVTLAHDVIVPLGFFAILGHFFGAQADTLFVTAMLTVLGFSVHDTIVVFDRVRENLRINHEHNRHESFEIIAGKSLNQTFVRSVNTSLTVLITLLTLFFLGPESTQDFALVLLVGIFAGTYSSIALATPLLVAWERAQQNKNSK